jgi:hypothetical protein
MPIGHPHPPGVFDAGHCRTRARQAGLLDHDDRVQGEEARLRQASAYARAARRTRCGRWDPPGSGCCWPRSPC